jgi:hypothetical protein
MNFLKSLIQKIAKFFTSGRAEAVLTTAAELVPKAIPVVEAVAALAPNKTDQEIAAAFAKYGQTFSTTWLTGPAGQRGALLLQLATQVLAGELPGVATNILNTAVQLAVTGSKA